MILMGKSDRSDRSDRSDESDMSDGTKYMIARLSDWPDFAMKALMRRQILLRRV